MSQFLSGAIMMGCWVAGLFFMRAWRKTADRLFLLFAMAFWLMALERVAAVPRMMQVSEEPWVFLLRLAAFGLIIAAIVDKNTPRATST